MKINNIICPNTGVSKGPFRGRRSNRNVNDWEDDKMEEYLKELEKVSGEI